MQDRISHRLASPVQTVKSATRAPVAAARPPGATAKTWCGVPAAAQTVGKSRSRGSSQASIGVRCPSGDTPPMAKPVCARIAGGVGLLQGRAGERAGLRRVDAVAAGGQEQHVAVRARPRGRRSTSRSGRARSRRRAPRLGGAGALVEADRLDGEAEPRGLGRDPGDRGALAAPQRSSTST